MNRHLRPARAMGALLLACAAILLAMWILRGAPPGFEAESQERQSLAHQVGAIVARDLDTAEPTRLRSDIEAWMAASEGVVSVGLRREDGRTLVEAGDVEYLRERWDRSSLTPDAVDIAILQGGERWGTLLVLFNPTLPGAANLGASGLTGWILVFALLLLPGAMLCVEILSRRRGLRAPGKDVVVASERARNTLDTLAEGVIVLDPRRRIVFANASARAILNEIRSDAPALEIDGLAWFDARTPNTPLDAPWARSAREDRTILGERLHLRIDERREFVFIVNATPIHAGKRLAGTLVTLDDVTDIEHSREKLREARDAAEAANQAKSSFLAMMSHEIRTPINGVSGTLELLQGTRLADRQRRYVEAARFSASTLLHIINDILDFSKIEAGQFELSPIDFDIEPCLDECMLMMSDHAFEKGLLLEYEIDDDVAESVHGDPARLRQILINLTKNAIKFTERGSVTITVAVEADGPNEQLLRFSVRDTGIGIPEDKQDRLFRAFSQVDSSMSRTAGGTGLGLAISRQLCELMGGRIGVESEAGKGSTFYFTARLQRREPVSQSRASLDSLSVLLVGPGAAERHTALRTLARAGADARVLNASDDLNSTVRDRPPEETIVILCCHEFGAAERQTCLALRTASSTLRIVAASLSPSSVDCENEPIDQWMRRPLGARRLVDAIEACRRAPASPESQQPDATLEQYDLRVLVAEDNSVGQLVAADMLSALGVKAEIVADGDSAIRAALSGAYQIILMDCFMPGMDGFEATRRIRELQRSGELPVAPRIVALTARAMKGDEWDCRQAGMDDFLAKPFNRQELLLKLQDQINALGLRPRDKQRDRSMDVPCPFTSSFDKHGWSDEVRHRLIEAFRESATSDVERVAQATAERNYQLMMHAGHRLRGSAAQIGAERLSELAGEIETRGEHAVSDGIDDLLSRLQDEFSRCLSSLPSLLERQDAHSRESKDAA